MILIGSGDNHLGCNLYKKLRKFYFTNFQEAVYKAIEIKQNNPNETVVYHVNGDLFDTDTPDIEIIKLTLTCFELLKSAGIILTGEFGNHDKWNSRFNMSPLNIFSDSTQIINPKLKKYMIEHTNKLEKTFDCYSYGNLESIEFDECNMVIQSWLPDDDMIRSQFEKAKKRVVKGKQNILCSHIAISEVFDFNNNHLSVKELPTKKFDFILLSDIHNAKTMEWSVDGCTIMYTSATFHTKINDMDGGVDPGFLVLDINKDSIEPEFIQLNQPEVITIESEDDINEKITDNIIKLKDPKLIWKVYKHKPIHVKFDIIKEKDSETGEVIEMASSISQVEEKILSILPLDESMMKFIKTLLKKDLSGKRPEIFAEVRSEFKNIIFSEEEL